MKKLVKFSLTVLCAATLAACGSGGGSSDGDKKHNINNGTNNTAPNTQNNSTPAPNANNPAPNTPPPSNNTQQSSSPVNGYYYSFDGTKLSPTALSLAGSNVNVLKVDGKEVSIAYPGMSAGAFLQLNNNTIISGTHVSEVKYGLAPVGNDLSVVFAQGNSTKDMPTSGAATYQGRFLHLAISGKTVSPAIGPSSFNVDFGAKKLTGSLNNGLVTLSADINGNTFEGTHNGVATKGGFYGPQASELGGVYSNSNPSVNIVGAYGAKKQ